MDKFSKILELINDEVVRANEKHGDLKDRNHVYGAIFEELRETEFEFFKVQKMIKDDYVNNLLLSDSNTGYATSLLNQIYYKTIDMIIEAIHICSVAERAKEMEQRIKKQKEEKNKKYQ